MESQAASANAPAPARGLAALALTALGIVYGDIGTSPLYALRECFAGEFGVAPARENVLGVLSLIFWALVVVVTLKYLWLVLRADNHGEGGVLALTALLLGTRSRGRPFAALVALGVFAGALLYGDGMITPAISVLSAVEGLTTLDARLESWVLPVTIAILVALFLFQHKGTARVGAVFGPVTLVWFATIAALGGAAVARRPEILAALLPTHAVAFLSANGSAGFLVLGAVFLTVTGAEALYADMGHFGVRPIRWAWGAVVLPSLLACYFGQGALLLARPEAAADPFYALAPEWMLTPLIALATLATIIASQAVISGAFSLTRQAVQLGYSPRMRIVQTSSVEIGQVYVPQVNWILMIATIGLVLGFRSSSGLAAAYGVAVTTTMLITTVLFCVLARTRFGWPLGAVVALAAVLLPIDLAFFGANASKLLHGAWFPLAIGAVLFVTMSTWRQGRRLLGQQLRDRLPRDEDFVRMTLDAQRVPGKAVFLTSEPELVPASLLHNLTHNHVLHAEIALLHIACEEVPRVPRDEKVTVRDLGEGFWQVHARYGFFETPNVPHVLALARERGLDFPLDDVSFFLGRERIRAHRRPGLSFWRAGLFAFLSRNALGATTYYSIPPAQVVEIGMQVEI
ncbi:MAG: potassium transporter Kup [Planctomycetes bacterium]|nr:potassium transporter Kup [Planctomycetota bacterium]